MPRDWIARQVERLPESWRDVAHRWWPVFAIAVGVALGTLAFVIGGHLLSDVSDQQDRDREQQDQLASQQAQIGHIAREALASTTASNRLSCVLSRAVTSIPLVRRPGESDADFHQRVRFAHLIVRLAEGIDCRAALAPVLHPTAPRGGGAQSPQAGSQLPGASRPPLPDRTVDMVVDSSRRKIPAQARILAVAEGQAVGHRRVRR